MTAEAILLFPFVILMIMLCVQTAVWYHAANIAQAAASNGAAAGAPRNAGAGPARASATSTASDNGAAVRGVVVAANQNTVTVTVRIGVAHIVPFFPDEVSRTFSEPRERFIPEDERDGLGG